MKSELMDSFGIVLVIYMLILLFSDLEKNFIRRNLARDFWAALEASVIMIFVTALTIFLQHNNADASRGVYFCIAGMNLVLFFVAHAAIKYYLLHIYRNKMCIRDRPCRPQYQESGGLREDERARNGSDVKLRQGGMGTSGRNI